eukprot:608733-Prorocentrum_minimum.AAC.1
MGIGEHHPLLTIARTPAPRVCVCSFVFMCICARVCVFVSLRACWNIPALPASDWSIVRTKPRFLRLIGAVRWCVRQFLVDARLGLVARRQAPLSFSFLTEHYVRCVEVVSTLDPPPNLHLFRGMPTPGGFYANLVKLHTKERIGARRV